MERTRVLVADDNGTYGTLLTRFVATQADMEVVGLAGDGDEAVRLASILHPDLVLMDLCMPGLDGLQATRVLAAADRGLKVIALTAHAGRDSEQRSLEAGASAFMRKADVDQRLLELIRAVISGEEVIPLGLDEGPAPA